MAYIIIAVVLALIIVPIIAVLPSARQKEQMNMRKHAMGEGVSVELRTIDDPNPDQEKYVSHTGKQLPRDLKVVAYRLQRRREGDWRRLPKVEWRLQRKQNPPEGNEFVDFVWVRKPVDDMSDELIECIESRINQLPDDVEQVEEVGYIITIDWHEKTVGQEQIVIDFLKHCAAVPLHKPDDTDVIEENEV